MYPRNPADLTVANLCEPLGLDRSSIASVDVEVIGQGVGILCQLARVKLIYNGDARGPKSVVAKFPAAIEQTRGLARSFKFYEREVNFYKQLAKDVSLPTARCFYASHDPATDDFLLLLEDLGDRRLGDQLKGCSAEEAIDAAQKLASFHAEWWESPKLKSLDWIPLSDSELNKAGCAIYATAWPIFLPQYGADLSAEMRSVGERLSEQIVGLLDRGSTRPRTICHGDYRLDNFFFGIRPGQPPLTIVDWQFARRGNGTSDVGYFMSQSVSPSLRREIELDLLRVYHDRLVEFGVRHYSFADCIDDYRWSLLFCLCYPVIAGAFGDVANARGVALAKAMTDRCVSAIKDWKAFEFLN